MQESAARSTLGAVAAIFYVGPRTVRLAAGGYTAYTSTRQSTATVTAIAWIGGREAVYVSAGTLRGYWLPLAAGITLL